MKRSGETGRKSVDGSDKDARIAELEAELARARQEMKAFSYSVSHDLRAPLRAIEGFSRILIEDFSNSLDKEGQHFLNTIVQNTQVMSELIEGLLSYHRLNEKPVAKAKVDMNALLAEVIAAVPQSARSFQVKIPKLPTVQGDPALLRIAWEQLFSNAVKFSKRQEHPSIEIGAEQRDGDQVLWIKDNGVGFDQSYSDKLFQVFQKLQKEPDFPGNGIGLALARRVAEKHSGQIWAEAQAGKGATFYFALPK
jgi:light-regulated signal transduction histidine kinase (bacteriophytochrome)